MATLYIWSEFTLDKLKEEVRKAKTLAELKEVIILILDETPTEYIQ